jgi:hypothetical protein
MSMLSTDLSIIPAQLTLSTQVIDSKTNETFAVEAVLTKKSPTIVDYTLLIHTIQSEIGNIEFTISNATYLYIECMRNLTLPDQDNQREPEIKRVGTALHELAFKISLALGFEGRIKFVTAWGSDIFHWKCGFRFEHEGLSPLFGFMNEDYTDMVREYAEKREEKETRKKIKALIKCNKFYPRLLQSVKKSCLRAEELEPQKFRDICERGWRYRNSDRVLDTIEKAKQDGIKPVINISTLMCLPDNKIAEFRQKYFPETNSASNSLVHLKREG